MSKKKILVFASVAFIAILASLLIFLFRSNKVEAPNFRDNSSMLNEDILSDTEAEQKSYLDIKSATSQYVLVNKSNQVKPQDYRPADLVVADVDVSSSDTKDEQSVREIVKSSLEKMMRDAKAEGLNLVMNSGFRSYSSQSFYFNNYVKQSGLEAAKKFSAQPGYSEHQTGLSFDLSYKNRECYLEICFAETKAGKWLADNAHKYGFILRYPEGKESITGYQYEPWHFRFLGEDIAKDVYEKKLTYEEYLSELGLISL
ncbi:MAG: zinc D-Ala-D-Ala carboxypeptidase [Patescibacteria group bacterium]|nr:zinc D-Ala-D-Ala carboxypeptidase [Patescibacteria group bacterium]